MNSAVFPPPPWKAALPLLLVGLLVLRLFPLFVEAHISGSLRSFLKPCPGRGASLPSFPCAGEFFFVPVCFSF